MLQVAHMYFPACVINYSRWIISNWGRNISRKYFTHTYIIYTTALIWVWLKALHVWIKILLFFHHYTTFQLPAEYTEQCGILSRWAYKISNWYLTYRGCPMQGHYSFQNIIWSLRCLLYLLSREMWRRV